MEVMIPLQQTMDHFDFNSARSTPYPSAPCTPTRVGEYYFSAPTSPRRLADFYDEFDEVLRKDEGRSSSAQVPFDWEVKPGTPKGTISNSMLTFEEDQDHVHDFAFDLSGEQLRTSLPADELFDRGVIKPLKPPPRLQLPATGTGSEDGYFSPRSHKSPLAHGKKIIRDAFSPREKKDIIHPLALQQGAGMEDIRNKREPERERGRERNYPLSSSSRRTARSVSPIRVSEYQWADELTKQPTSTANQKPPISTTTSTTTSAMSTFSKGFKWRLKDLFLFRSASDGRAMARDPWKKYYSPSFIRKQEDSRNASSRSIESPRPGFSSRASTRGKNVSPHELHYTVNRAYSEDMKKKTFLPYKQGILGRLSFNPTVSYGLGFSRN